ncbi:MAG TPA: peroxiredoxin [Phycisphaerales bacterium]|nr:peroxiredoxin [Phycisphaerales bacterium]
MSRPLREGDVVPDFERPDQAGRVWRLSGLRGGWVVLFFYPRDFSPVCTRQACLLRDAMPRLTAGAATVLGISAGDAASHRAFIERHQLPYPLLSDADGSLARLLGVRRRLLGLVPGRETIVIDPSGRVEAVYRALADGEGHAARALEAVERATTTGGASTET